MNTNNLLSGGKSLFSLYYYLKNNVSNYDSITEIPEANLTDLKEKSAKGWKVTNASHAFYFGTELTNLDISFLQTKNLYDVSCLAYFCMKAKSINFSGLNVSRVTDAGAAFSWCEAATSIDLTGWRLYTVNHIYNLFEYCGSDTAGGLTIKGLEDLWVGLGVRRVMIDAYNCFYRCGLSGALDLSRWTFAKSGNNMNAFLGNCYYLTDITMPSATPEDFGAGFRGCTALKNINFENFSFAACTNVKNLFNGAKALTSVNGYTFDFSAITAASNAQDAFKDCGLTEARVRVNSSVFADESAIREATGAPDTMTITIVD